jgi:hypothetical protein
MFYRLQRLGLLTVEIPGSTQIFALTDDGKEAAASVEDFLPLLQEITARILLNKDRSQPTQP